MNKELTQLWKKVLADLETEVSRGSYVTLFKPTTLIAMDDTTATIAAPSNMLIDLLQKRFYGLIKQSVDKHSQKDLTLIFVPKQEDEQKTSELPMNTPGSLFESLQTNTLSKSRPNRVRADFTFKTLAVSSSNQLAFVACDKVARHLGQIYNPLFIYGPVGVGKTHLMHAIANEVFAHDPDKNIMYLTSEEFTNDVVDAIRTNETAKMKRRFRSVSLLIIDDIQFIAGKDRVQEELFHTFNILIDNGSQIVLSSDRPPHEIKKLEKRLSSRFAGGLTVDVETPDFELRAAILLIKAKKFNYDLPMDVAKQIAESAEDARSLEGLLLRVITETQARGSEPSLGIVDRILGNRLAEQRGALHVEDVIKAVCAFYNIKQTQIKGPKRDASLVKARQIAMYLLKKELQLTFVEIGNLLGGRDHTTVMHGVEKVENLLETHERLEGDISGIIKTMRG